MQEVQNGAIGVDIILTITEDDVAVDISTTTLMQIVFRKPNRTVTTPVTAVFNTDGVNGKMKYRSISGTFDVNGRWEAQGIVTFPGGYNGRSKVIEFTVLPNL